MLTTTTITGIKGYTMQITLPNGLTYRRFELPRKGKAPRQICAPSKELLKVQRAALPRLERAFWKRAEEHEVNEVFHGFLKNRNCVTAAQQHIGYDATLMMDISAFFDSVTQEHTRVTTVSGYTIEGTCGQGFATSPILANLGIVHIASAIKKYLQDTYTDYAFTIYADDIQISINSSDPYTECQSIADIVTAAFEYNGFQIHPHKTRIRLAKHGYRRILGINVGNDHIRATRKTMRKLRAAKHQGNHASAGGLTVWSQCLRPKALR